MELHRSREEEATNLMEPHQILAHGKRKLRKPDGASSNTSSREEEATDLT